MMKVATIDIGTNSVRLLIATTKEDQILQREKFVTITSLGKGIDKSGILSQEAMDRTITALVDYAQKAKKENCTKIDAIATSALRDSVNKQEFIDQVQVKAGITVHIITGKEEAYLGYLGAKTLKSEKGYTLMIDIGGGSTEFTLGDMNDNIVFSESYDVGAVRLTRDLNPSHPPTKQQLENIITRVNYILREPAQILNEFNITEAVAIGGTASSLASIHHKMEIFKSEIIHRTKLTVMDIENIYDMLKVKTLEEKQMIKGLQPQRAEVILQGTIIMRQIMDKLGLPYITVSEYDNLEGLIYQNLF